MLSVRPFVSKIFSNFVNLADKIRDCHYTHVIFDGNLGIFYTSAVHKLLLKRMKNFTFRPEFFCILRDLNIEDVMFLGSDYADLVKPDSKITAKALQN